MSTIRIFISSVQTEFAQERITLRDFLQNDPLMRRFFDVFLFEDVPASDRRPDELYLDEVSQSDLYIGLFGNDYGNEDKEGISPTEREFDQATTSGIHRLIFVKGTADGPMSKSKILIKLGHKKISGQLKKVVRSLLAEGLIEYTLPDKLRSPRQLYRLTDKGKTELSNLKSEKVV